jgi:hypothetical protein
MSSETSPGTLYLSLNAAPHRLPFSMLLSKHCTILLLLGLHRDSTLFHKTPNFFMLPVGMIFLPLNY